MLDYIDQARNLWKQWNQPRPVPTQPTPRLYYKVYMLFLIHITTIWSPTFYVYRYDIYLFLAITCLIIWIKPEIWGTNGTQQDQYQPNHYPTVLQSLYVLPNTYFYSMKSNLYVYRYDIYLSGHYLLDYMDQASNLRNQWNQPRPVPTQQILWLYYSLYVLPNTYYYNMKSNFYVYRHNIYLFLAITCLIIWIKPEICGSNGTNQDQYQPNQHMDCAIKFICSS